MEVFKRLPTWCNSATSACRSKITVGRNFSPLNLFCTDKAIAIFNLLQCYLLGSYFAYITAHPVNKYRSARKYTEPPPLSFASLQEQRAMYPPLGDCIGEGGITNCKITRGGGGLKGVRLTFSRNSMRASYNGALPPPPILGIKFQCQQNAVKLFSCKKRGGGSRSKKKGGGG